MRVSTAFALPCLAAAAAAAAGEPGLTPAEARWLRGAAPVIAWAEAQRMPLDIVVQPQDAPGLAPMALAFEDGRCQLVLSLRGNPLAEEALAGVPPGLEGAALELMAAHELGHCRRWLDGAWRGVPAGFLPADASEPGGLSDTQRPAWREMRETRREEGYGDLVGLAWTAEHHAPAYPALHAWLLAQRAQEPAGGHHDTRAWLALAPGAQALAAAGTGASPFERAAPLWRQGLAIAP
ncbi:hypothetical protein [Ideonella sp.]|uniref:hypothetical protein n=1 Tax=Ideonella sp. TaxID=1929293 RepID=UPI0035B39AAF